MERCLFSLAIREMQIESTRTYHFTHKTLVNIRKSDNTKSQQGRRETGILVHWWVCKLVQPMTVVAIDVCHSTSLQESLLQRAWLTDSPSCQPSGSTTMFAPKPHFPRVAPSRWLSTAGVLAVDHSCGMQDSSNSGVWHRNTSSACLRSFLVNSASFFLSFHRVQTNTEVWRLSLPTSLCSFPFTLHGHSLSRSFTHLVPSW